MKYDIIVIGAGLAGLTAAYYLTKERKKVLWNREVNSVLFIPYKNQSTGEEIVYEKLTGSKRNVPMRI